MKEKTPAASTSAVPADHSSNWDTEGPPLQTVPVVFASNDLRFNMDASARERSNMAFKVTHFGGKELKKEWHNRASETDLRRHLKRQGVATARDMIRRVVTVMPSIYPKRIMMG